MLVGQTELHSYENLLHTDTNVRYLNKLKLIYICIINNGFIIPAQPYTIHLQNNKSSPCMYNQCLQLGHEFDSK